jgi:hypothetical protein
MTATHPNDMRCPVCLLEFNSEEMKRAGVRGCAKCHTSIPPIYLAHDGYVKVNWQDLRVLAIYAQRWSIGFDLRNKGNQDALKALENIINHLRQYKPKNAAPIVPLVDVVRVRGDAEHDVKNIPIQFNIHIPLPKRYEWKPDHTGFIPSPFYQKKPPEQPS